MVDKNNNHGGDDPALDVDIELHEAEGSLLRGWPALLLTIGMISAAVYAFSPRPEPSFPETEVKVDEILANGLVRQGSRFIAVGELGRILIADDPEGPWREAEIDPQRGATLTRVEFVARDVAIAVGHNAWILRSEDAGETWTEVQFDAQRSDPLLGVAGPFPGSGGDRLFAYGAFGQFFISEDLGRTWRNQGLTMVEVTEKAGDAVQEEPVGDVTAPESEDYDPFAAFAAGGGAQDLGSGHLYAMAQAADGSLFLAGERGFLARSSDGGDTWSALDELYSGSFYGVLAVPDENLLVFGMRGNAFLSADFGQTWERSAVPVNQGLFGGVVSEGEVALVGASNTLLLSKDGGKSFRKVLQRGPHGLVSILPLAGDAWLTAGEGGVRLKDLDSERAPGVRGAR